MLTQARLKEILHYNQETGEFTNILKRINAGEIGSTAGCIDHFYLRISVDGKLYYCHRLAWLYMTGEFPCSKIDHKNGARSDNSWKNLRLVSHKKNLENIRKPYKNNKSGFLGVSYSKTMKKFEACLRHNYKTLHLGYFELPIDAYNRYLEVKREIHEGCTL